MEEQKPSQFQSMRVHWTSYVSVVVAVVTVAFAVFITPAAAAYRGNQDTIHQLQVAIQNLLERQERQDERQDKLEVRVDRQGEMLANIDKQTALSAKTLEWISSWIKAGGQK